MMSTAEEILELCTEDGELDRDEWPQVREAILKRLDEIVHNEFPLPSLPPQQLPEAPIIQSNAPLSTQTTDLSSQISTNSEVANKENAPPSSPPQAAIPPVPAFGAHSSTQNTPLTNGALPPSVLPNYNFIRRALQTQFISYPPHTIQRLAELVLRPKQHYRFLPAYLNALDRVLSVSSGTDRFIREKAVDNNAGLSNGNILAANALGSDESLGGALLTPIAWLRHEQGNVSNQDDQNSGADDLLSGTTLENVETGMRDAGSLTQGELLRQEQESGIVPVPLDTSRSMELGDKEQDAVAEEVPHARGPEEVGVADLGPQHATGPGQKLDMAAAAGRPAPSKEKDGQNWEEGMPGSDILEPDQEIAAPEKADHDGNLEIGDAEESIEKQSMITGAASPVSGSELENDK